MFPAINTIDSMFDLASQAKAIAAETADTLALLAEHIDWEALVHGLAGEIRNRSNF